MLWWWSVVVIFMICIYQCYMLVRYDDDGLGVGDPLQSIRDIVVVSQTPKHKRVPPEKKHPHMLGHPTLPSGEI